MTPHAGLTMSAAGLRIGELRERLRALGAGPLHEARVELAQIRRRGQPSFKLGLALGAVIGQEPRHVTTAGFLAVQRWGK